MQRRGKQTQTQIHISVDYNKWIPVNLPSHGTEMFVGQDRLNGHRRLMIECLVNRGMLVDGEDLQDMECPVSRFSKWRKLI